MSDEYEYGPWIGWNGGFCPVGDKTLVQVVCAEDGADGGFYPAELYEWQHSDTHDDIIAYRIATPKPKRELVVGKWYRDERGIWRECIFTDGELAWLRWQSADTAYVWELDGYPKDLGPSAAIDWSTPPRDEAPE